MKLITKNLIDAFEDKEVESILHGVNCQHKMASGIALEIRNRLPEAFMAYSEFCRSHPIPINRLGRVATAQTESGVVFNVFTQLNYGREKKRFVNYEAIAQGLEEVAAQCKERGIKSIGVPFLFACGLGGGSWPIVEKFLEVSFDKSGAEVILFKLE